MSCGATAVADRVQQVVATIRVALPLDPVEMAATLAKVAAAWQQFTVAMKDSGVKIHEQEFSMMKRASARPYRRKAPLEVVNG